MAEPVAATEAAVAAMDLSQDPVSSASAAMPVKASL
jgi:hypothetical protein